MSKSSFAKIIINKINRAIGTNGSNYSSGSANLAMSAIAQAITDYLKDNTEVVISYSGIISGTPPTPDPITTDTFKIEGECKPPKPSNNFNNWLLELQNNIVSGFVLEAKGKAGVSFEQKPFISPNPTITQISLKNAHDASDNNPQQKIWEVVCDGIINWINTSAINTVSGSATRMSGTSSGTAVIKKISIT